MGGKHSKKENNDELKKIGEDANKESPSTFCSFTPIKLNNELLVSKLKSDPDEDYKRLNFLGEGSFASVYRVQNRYTDVICAMKIIKKNFSCSAEDEKDIFNEINILRMMDHPGVLKLFEFYSNKQNYSIVIVIKCILSIEI